MVIEKSATAGDLNIRRINSRAKKFLFIAAVVFSLQFIYFATTYYSNYSNAGLLAGFVFSDTSEGSLGIGLGYAEIFYLIAGLFLLISFFINIAFFRQIQKIIGAVSDSNSEILGDINSLNESKLDGLKETVANRNILLGKLDTIKGIQKKEGKK